MANIQMAQKQSNGTYTNLNPITVASNVSVASPATSVFPSGTDNVQEALASFGDTLKYRWLKQQNTSYVTSSTTVNAQIYKDENNSNSSTIRYSTSIAPWVSGDPSTPVLVNPTVQSFPYNDASIVPTLKGKYFTADENNDSNAVYYADQNISLDDQEHGSTDYVYVVGARPVTATIYPFSVVESYNRNAFPDSGVNGNFIYNFLGGNADQLSSPALVDSGVFTGTGTSPMTLALPFPANFVYIIQQEYSSSGYPNPYFASRHCNFAYKLSKSTLSNNMAVYTEQIKFSGNNITISDTFDSGVVYAYFAIGGSK